VLGEVRNPGAFPFTPDTTVRQAISLAGGFGERASSGVRIVRKVGGARREIKVSLEDLVQPGDTVVVKQRLF
jgi:polysaccharide export outer membrane protein